MWLHLSVFASLQYELIVGKHFLLFFMSLLRNFPFSDMSLLLILIFINILKTQYHYFSDVKLLCGLDDTVK